MSVPQDPWPAPRAEGPVDAVVTLPGSKSLTNRALVLAALADVGGVGGVAPVAVRRALRSRDTLLMAAALGGLGATVDTRGGDWTVAPLPRGPRPLDPVRVDCGLAGTVMRFVPPLAGLVARPASFDGDPHMRSRPIGVVLDALRHLGVDVDDAGRGALPFVVRGTGSVRGGAVTVDASTSSQFVSALLLAAPAFDEGLDLRHDGKPVPSLPHVEMTVAMLRERGVAVDDAEPDRWVVEPGPVAAVDAVVEPDLSNAGPFLALAAVTGGSVTVRDWPERTHQAGDAWRGLLADLGCTVDRTDDGLRVRGPDGGASGLRGVDVDLHDVGELTPVLAALCALAPEPSHLRGVGHIRGHETDRLAALATELGGLGADVVERDDGLSFRPARLHGGTFATYADHRMAHAGVVVGAAVDGVAVRDVATTAKTFPDFAAFWAALL